jgi:hypothetical protein
MAARGNESEDELSGTEDVGILLERIRRRQPGNNGVII